MQRLISSTLVVLFGLCSSLLAEAPSSSLAELHRLAVAASDARRADRAKLEQFLSSAPAQRALKRAGMDPKQVVRAVAALSPEDAARLAARAETARREFAAGALTNQQLTYVAIALGTAVFILILIVAAD